MAYIELQQPMYIPYIYMQAVGHNTSTKVRLFSSDFARGPCTRHTHPPRFDRSPRALTRISQRMQPSPAAEASNSALGDVRGLLGLEDPPAQHPVACTRMGTISVRGC